MYNCTHMQPFPLKASNGSDQELTVIRNMPKADNVAIGIEIGQLLGHTHCSGEYNSEDG